MCVLVYMACVYGICGECLYGCVSVGDGTGKGIENPKSCWRFGGFKINDFLSFSNMYLRLNDS